MAEKILVAGEWKDGSGPTIEIRFPYDGRVVGEVFLAQEKDVQASIDAAATAFGKMRKMSSGQRRIFLEHVSSRIAQNKEELAKTICLEAGKPIKQARAEVQRAVETFRIAAQEAERIGGELQPIDFLDSNKNRFYVTRPFPLGVVAAITPFNFPLNLVAHKVAPAFAAGNCVVHKPSTLTPLTALKLAEIMTESGLLPRGALSVLVLTGDKAGTLVASAKIKALSFTGSHEVGWALKNRCGKKRIILELGGNAAAVVCKDTPLDSAIPRLITGCFAYAGQICISVQRLLVEAEIYDDFLDAFVKATKRLKTGNPLDPNTTVGPMITQKEADRVISWIEEAEKKGAKILIGGQRAGPIVQPTVLENVPHDCKLWKEELFGPAVAVEKFHSFEHAVELVNESRFGLQAAIFTTNLDRILYFFREVEVGGVIVGDMPTFRADSMPYGGEKDSGLGREGLKYAIAKLTQLRTMVLSFPQ